MDKQTWEARRVCIGGSEAPAVMNLSRFGRTPMSVWADKVSLTEFNEQDQTLRQWVGLRLEPLIAEMAGARLGRKFVRRHGLILSKTHPWMGGNVDDVGLECNTSRGAEGWGPDLTVIETMDDIGAVPIDYLIQCLHYLFVTGCKQVTLAVLMGHDDFRTFEVHPVPTTTSYSHAARCARATASPGALVSAASKRTPASRNAAARPGHSRLPRPRPATGLTMAKNLFKGP